MVLDWYTFRLRQIASLIYKYSLTSNAVYRYMNTKLSPISKDSHIGIIGFALVLISPLTCWLTLIPGFICSIIGVKKKSFLSLSWTGYDESGNSGTNLRSAQT